LIDCLQPEPNQESVDDGAKCQHSPQHVNGHFKTVQAGAEKCSGFHIWRQAMLDIIFE
jgi:hypothetical protein